MPANSSIILSNLDFDTQKNTLKAYLRAQDKFKDYDFDGSNMSVLLDLLAYNSYMNAFYLNMVASEMFLDSAQLKDSVVSHAKELNYTPRSFKSATANVNISILMTDIPANTFPSRSLLIPRGYSLSGKLGASSFTFTTDENIVVNDVAFDSNAGTAVYSAPNVTIYEGELVVDSFTTNPSIPQRYILSNKNVDISSIRVTVLEDGGATPLVYARSLSLFDVTPESKIFFVQGSTNDSYEIIFGDNVFGREPKKNSVITVEYRISSGELPNGVSSFRPDGPIDGLVNITVTTNSFAGGGAVSESLESIRYNAPRHFNTQERAITTEDYETLMAINFPEVQAVTAFGGETVDPPQFGKVFVSVSLKDVDHLPQTKVDQYYKFLKPRSPVSIDPVFVDPDKLYIGVNSTVKYNINKTTLNMDDISTFVVNSILTYSSSYLNDFNKTLRYSRLIESIDNAHDSIVSNETYLTLIKYITPPIGKPQSYFYNFGMKLDVDTPPSFYSSPFVYNNQTVRLADDSKGNINIVASSSSGKDNIIKAVGTVDYANGIIQINNVTFDAYRNNVIKLYTVTDGLDISTVKNTIMTISEADAVINVTQIRE